MEETGFVLPSDRTYDLDMQKLWSMSVDLLAANSIAVVAGQSDKVQDLSQTNSCDSLKEPSYSP